MIQKRNLIVSQICSKTQFGERAAVEQLRLNGRRGFCLRVCQIFTIFTLMSFSFQRDDD